MWLTRVLLFLAEYGALLLSLISPVIAYLLNFDRRKIVDKEQPTFKDVWLKSWVRFRDRLKEKGVFGELVIPVVTLALAFALTPLINRVVTFVGTLWEQTALAYPYKALRVGVCFLLFAVAWMLFLMRKRLPRGYAFLEIGIGLWMAWDALSFVQQPDGVEVASYFASRLLSPDVLRIMAAVYVIIRGLVNWNDRSRHPLLPQPPVPKPA